MRWVGLSWRWLIVRTVIGVMVVFAVAAFLYPHLWHWFALAAVLVAGAQTVLLIRIWRRWRERLRSSGFRW